MLWRAITRAAPFLTGRTMIMAGHQDQKFVCYPITPVGGDGRSTSTGSPSWRVRRRAAAAGLVAAGRSRRLRRRFAAWRFDWLDVPALIAAHRPVYEYPLVDRDPLPRWSTARVTLLGDAAHPMYPIGSNGASQAILDAEALAPRSAAEPDARGGPRRVRGRAPPPRPAIVLVNRGNGPEQVMQLAEERAPDGFADIHDVIPRAELEAIAARYKRLAGFCTAAGQRTGVFEIRRTPAVPLLRGREARRGGGHAPRRRTRRAPTTCG